MCRTSIRYQVQNSQGVQERRGNDERAETDPVGVERPEGTRPGRVDRCLDGSDPRPTLTLAAYFQDLTPPMGRLLTLGTLGWR